MKNKILIIAISLLFYNNIYAVGGKMQNTVDLALEFKLENSTKIIIQTLEKIKYKPFKKITITDKNTLNSIINELKKVKESGGIDTWCEYKIEFHNSDAIILELEFYGRPELSFLRYRSKQDNISKDYLVSKELYYLLSSVVEEE